MAEVTIDGAWNSCTITEGGLPNTYDGNINTSIRLQENQSCGIMWFWGQSVDLLRFEMYVDGFSENESYVHHVQRLTQPFNPSSPLSNLVTVHQTPTYLSDNLWSDVLNGQGASGAFGIIVWLTVLESIWFDPYIKEVRGEYLENYYSLDITITGQGSVTKNPNWATYPAGTEVTLTATPSSGWRFVQWGGDISETSNPIMIVMDGDKDITAYFSEIGTDVTCCRCVGTQLDCTTFPSGTVCGYSPAQNYPYPPGHVCENGGECDCNQISESACITQQDSQGKRCCWWYSKYFWEEPACYPVEQTTEQMIKDYLPFIMLGVGGVILIAVLASGKKKPMQYPYYPPPQYPQ